MGVFVFLICVVVFCIVFVKLTEDVGVYEFNGKKYRMECVSMDLDRAYNDSIDLTLGKITQQEYKRRSNRGVYRINAWVEVGKSTYTWKEDPINKDTFLKFAHDADSLPQYLRTDKLKTVRDYRKQKAIRK